jgi:GxxExxY protein
VEDCVLVELKAVKILDEVHQAQCINYLKATGMRLCLLLNFGTRRVGIKRIAL